MCEIRKPPAWRYRKAKSMLREVEQRKARWMKERALEKQRKSEGISLKDEQKQETLYEPTRKLPGKSAGNSFKDEQKQEVLHEPTISRKPLGKSMHHCPLCSKLMQGDSRTPILIIPCGHTYCSACFNLLRQNQCPSCSCEIESYAINHSLKTVITAAQKPIVNYKAQVDSLTTRISILVNELHHANEAKKLMELKAGAFQKSQYALEQEEKVSREEFERARLTLELVQKHVEEQRRKYGVAVEEVTTMDIKSRDLQANIDRLNAELDKCKILA